MHTMAPIDAGIESNFLAGAFQCCKKAARKEMKQMVTNIVNQFFLMLKMKKSENNNTSYKVNILEITGLLMIGAT